ncbi:hypothetical protein LJC09_05255, partial [Desulfovibrio sp. OttesenSCG-928-F20]|nr:hypothetical protein [Desulfovibrio sp. OttesenSCG-928-F20]
DEAHGLQTLKEEFSLSQDDLAQALGKSRSAIANSLRLLSLPESMRPLLAEGKLSPGHARALLSISDPKAQEYLKNLILESRISVREAEGLAAGWKQTGRFELAMLHLEGSGFESQDAASEPQQKTGAQMPGKGTTRAKSPQSARLLDIQNTMTALFQAPVRVMGKESKGRISFSYNSEAELAALLERLGASDDQGRLSAAAAQTESLPTTDHEHGESIDVQD